MKTNYWREVYGERSNEFIAGVVAGVTTLAIWRSGAQYVGVLETPLEEAIDLIKEGMGWREPKQDKDKLLRLAIDRNSGYNVGGSDDNPK